MRFSAVRRPPRATAGLVLVYVLFVAAHFPWAADEPQTDGDNGAQVVASAAEAFYQDAYEPESSGEDGDYVETAREAASKFDVKQQLNRFIEKYELQDKRVLEVGAGSGTLQDLVEDYTGLDIAASAARYFHKPFVAGSATDLPFENDEFDSVWSIWVLEHLPEPEAALAEMRRVTRHGGMIYLRPAWNCPPWLGEGYPVRPYSDFSLGGKLVKASIALRKARLFKAAHRVPARLLRLAAAGFGPTRLRYRPLDANFDRYWMGDSDATTSVDCYETMLWFVSRGDECPACGSLTEEIFESCREELIIRATKPSA